MKYVALLRGINVGGNNIIKMLALKEAFEIAGMKNVSTYIQSGNVIFESDEHNLTNLTHHIEEILTQTFHYNARVIIKSSLQMKHILLDIPQEWKKEGTYRCYIAFLSDSVSIDAALKVITPKEGVDTLKEGKGVIYMTTLLIHLTKSSLNKLPSLSIYQEMTIRNFNTIRKLVALMEHAT